MQVTLRLLVAALFVAYLASQADTGKAFARCATASWGSKGDFSSPFATVRVDYRIGRFVTVKLHPLSDATLVGVDVAVCDASRILFVRDLTIGILVDKSMNEETGLLTALGYYVNRSNPK